MRQSAALTQISIAVLISACSTFVGETPTDTGSGDTGSPLADGDPGSTTEPSATGCVRFTGDHSSPVDTGSVATDALYLSGEVFFCADDAVVVADDDLNEVAAGSQLAAAFPGPLLFPDPRLAAELGRLDVKRVHLIGDVDVNVPSGAEVVEHDVASAVDLAAEVLGTGEEVTLPRIPDASTIVETVLAIDGSDRVAVPRSTVSSTTAPDQSDDVAVSEIVTGLAVESEAPSLWLVDATRPRTILLAAALGSSLGASVVAIDADDVLGYPEVGAALGSRGPESTRFIGGSPDVSEWELAALANGEQLPGGGFYILPEGEMRRYLAYYGHPETDGLGVLGEQGPAASLERMQGLIEEYGADGAQVIPTFEMIASVAAAGPTDDGDYSFEWPVETFQPWIDFAAEHEMYVVLDLQPGREDFLGQAVQYEELLRLPHVGLALDPEWRLGNDQVHLEQVGSVSASEVNQVIEWVADLVRNHGLPQKMLIVHQFRRSMITERENLAQRPEVQVVIQMDGEGGPGGESTKDATYHTITEGTENAHWAWGWKNFFDEDEPGPPPPANVMRKDPPPIYISYQ